MTDIVANGPGGSDAPMLDDLPATLDIEIVPLLDAAPIARSNRMLAQALARGRDALLLDDGARPDAAALTEMIAVAALDPMIGFVAARRGGAATPERRLPRIAFAPSPPGGALFVRHAMLREFGLLDEGYRGADAALADLVRRGNRRGYRVAVANRARVAATPAPAIERADAERLAARYPEHDRALAYHADGATTRAAALAEGLVPGADGRLGLLFDCRMLQPLHNGTFEHVVRLLSAFVPLVADRYAVAVMAGDEAWRFHGLDRVPGLARHGDGVRRHAIAFRIGQPFIREDILTLADRAPLTGFLMLDTIALDCAHVSVHDLDKLWRVMADVATLIGFNSDASRAQFRRRFVRTAGGARDFVSRCSTDVADYAEPSPAFVPHGGVLLVGNGYEHKHVLATLAALRARAPGVAVRVLGMAGDAGGAGGHALADLTQEEAAAHYRAADVVLYPSHVEGFGLPILHALAAGTPVVARDLPPAREIAARSPYAANIHLAPDTDTLVALAVDPPAWASAPAPSPHSPESWRDAAAALAGAFDRAVAEFDFEACVARQSRLAWLRGTLEADGRTHEAAHRADAEAAAARAARDRAEAETAAAWAAQERAEAEAADASAARIRAEEATAAREAAEAAAVRAETLATYGAGGDDAYGDTAPLAAAIVSAACTRSPPSWWHRLREMLPGRAIVADASIEDDPVCEAREPLLLDAGAAIGEERLATLLVGWARAVARGGLLRLFCMADTADAAERALRLAGLCPTRIARRRRRTTIEAVKTLDWAAPLPGPPDDALFATIACRRALSRDPVAGELADAAAMPRDAFLAALYASSERGRLIDAAIARLSGDGDQLANVSPERVA